METNVEKIKLFRISGHVFPVKIMIDQNMWSLLNIWVAF